MILFYNDFFLVTELSDILLNRRKRVKDEVVVINKLLQSSAGYSKRISNEVVLNVDTRSWEVVHEKMKLFFLCLWFRAS